MAKNKKSVKKGLIIGISSVVVLLQQLMRCWIIIFMITSTRGQ